jgi:hypothetical protein
MPFNKKSARTRAKAFFQYFRGFDSNIFNKIIPGCGAVTKAGTTHPIKETERKSIAVCRKRNYLQKKFRAQVALPFAGGRTSRVHP